MAIFDKNGDVLSSCYNKDGDALMHAYDKNGDAIFASGTPIPDYDDFTLTDYKRFVNSNTQACDIYGKYLIQFRGGSSVNDIANLYDISNNSTIKTGMTIQSGHGNTASFSKNFYDEQDVMPLLYCCNHVDSPTSRQPTSVTVNRVDEDTATLIKTYLFKHPVNVFWGYACFDFDNEIVYTVGLSGNSYTSDLDGANKVVVTKWSLAEAVDNGDGTYDAVYISRYERDFIYVMQGMQYRNGIIWIASGYNNTTYPQMVYGMNAETGKMRYAINTGMTTEIEGIAWLDDYHLVVGFMGGTYKLLTFGEKS